MSRNRGAYTWNSEEYARNSSAQLGWARELIDKLSLRGTEAVLDIGCGNGQVTSLIATHVPRGEVIGIDNSETMVSFARRRYPPTKHPSLSFVRMDAAGMRFEDRFDVIFSNAALHWVKDNRAVLRGVRAGLKLPGRILLQMGGRGNARDIVDTVDSVRERNRWHRYFDGFTFPYAFCSPEEYSRWLKEAGLEPRRIELIPKDMTQRGRDGLAGWIRTTWLPYTERIPEELREEFIEEVVSLYTERFPVDDRGLVRVRMVRLEVEAVSPS